MTNWFKGYVLVWTTPLVVILVAGFIILMVRDCGVPNPPGPKIPPATQHTIDSLGVTQPTFQARQDSLRAQVTEDSLKVHTIIHRIARNDTNVIRQQMAAMHAAHVADSLAMDQKWQDAYAARSAEADSLLGVVAKKDSTINYWHAAYLAEHSAKIALTVAYTEDTTRRVALERVNADLQRSIAQLEQPCRIVGPIPCPSRTVTMVVSTVVTATAMSIHR